jgi:hypothetical protein
MKYLWIGCLLAASCPIFAGTQDSEFNVNTRYTVENILVAGAGWTTDLVASHDDHISFGIRRDLVALIGQKLNPAALDDLAKRLRKEFRARTVDHHVMRGKTPDTVQVVFDIKLRPARFDVSVPKFAYNSNQGWNGAAEATATLNHNSFTAGLASDSDELLERYTGVEARYENSHLGSDNVRFKFEFDDFHDLWNPQTAADAGGAIYRTRQSFEPVLTLAVARPLTVSFGMSFERMQDEGRVYRKRPVPPPYGRRRQPAGFRRGIRSASGHAVFGERLCLQPAPLRIPLYLDARQTDRDRRRHGWLHHRRSPALRSFRAGQ